MSSNSDKFSAKVLAQFPGVRVVHKYTSAKQPAILGCANGHKWQVIPSNLLSRGNGGVCPICSGNHQYKLVDGTAVFCKKKTTSDFCAELRSINPKITLIGEYEGAHIPVTIKCECKHTWQALPTNILSRHEEATCPVCNPRWDKYRSSLEDAQAKIQEKYPELELVEYTGSGKDCVVKSTQCGHQFSSWFTNIAAGRGYRCTTCVPVYGRSKAEQAIAEFITKNYTGWIELNDRKLLKPKELDIVLPDLGLAFEYNSPYTHHDKDHLYKTNAVEELGFRLIQINEDEWNHKREIVKSRILSLLGATLRIGARKCKVKHINYPREFLEANHIQGCGSPSSHNYGLFLENELVAVMTFSKPRFNKNYDYELVRYCSLTGVTITGGASKLLAAFRKDFPDTSILSYSDKRWSQGGLYRSLGFTYSHTSAPSYVYYKNNIKLSRYQCQKHLLEELFPEVYDPALTEGQIMEAAKFNRMYDCGTDVWILGSQTV